MRELVSSSTSSPIAALVAAGHAALRGWWEEVNESPAWQDGAFFSLTAAYALVSAVALVSAGEDPAQSARVRLDHAEGVPPHELRRQWVRAVVFGFHAYVFLLQTKVYKLVLLDLPGLLFFSAYTLLVLFWAEIYHQARSLPTDKLRIIYLAVNSIVYAIQICIWVYLGINDNALVELVSKIFIVSVSAVALLGFAVYGGRLFVLLRRFPIESKGRKKKLYEGWDCDDNLLHLFPDKMHRGGSICI
ncbi:unnamed protein product [Triticum turgidum subsp. durum]|uniref:THH1/TOM1/TOM3 domain-containing protein n=1 Tax=Triticum turgidum subsp. durum TaxID=4567 RepID=A0A9R1NTN6_TRITD|nr:unnamed protein product [Triticum turgidum subsp. durum]